MFVKDQASEHTHTHPYLVTPEVLGVENTKYGTVSAVLWEQLGFNSEEHLDFCFQK